MRVRVRFRYRADTGEVEIFQVDDLPDGTPLPDHDTRHDRATADVARIIDPSALIDELLPGSTPPLTPTTHTPAEEPPTPHPSQRLPE
jgi:hypothetical protein